MKTVNVIAVAAIIFFYAIYLGKMLMQRMEIYNHFDAYLECRNELKSPKNRAVKVKKKENSSQPTSAAQLLPMR